ncbi:hypothetical protein BNJ_00249 [Kaumoebavirus]|uniref:hypothetical protein n=1 Tax=Kaumoebavirus TaxID=1859492 RepID=UPI0009C2DE73|nr:hypothetical protein BNJ_00249 [Kaumoebavirus]ARA72077.1 hypothetical protein BNJ_00249 [Kaumoebavirus]
MFPPEILINIFENCINYNVRAASRQFKEVYDHVYGYNGQILSRRNLEVSQKLSGHAIVSTYPGFGNFKTLMHAIKNNPVSTLILMSSMEKQNKWELKTSIPILHINRYRLTDTSGYKRYILFDIPKNFELFRMDELRGAETWTINVVKGLLKPKKIFSWFRTNFRPHNEIILERPSNYVVEQHKIGDELIGDYAAALLSVVKRGMSRELYNDIRHEFLHSEETKIARKFIDIFEGASYHERKVGESDLEFAMRMRVKAYPHIHLKKMEFHDYLSKNIKMGSKDLYHISEYYNFSKKIYGANHKVISRGYSTENCTALHHFGGRSSHVGKILNKWKFGKEQLVVHMYYPNFTGVIVVDGDDKFINHL